MELKCTYHHASLEVLDPSGNWKVIVDESGASVFITSHGNETYLDCFPGVLEAVQVAEGMTKDAEPRINWSHVMYKGLLISFLKDAKTNPDFMKFPNMTEEKWQRIAKSQASKLTKLSTSEQDQVFEEWQLEQNGKQP